jgi:YVTN family beta-propeller protein
MKLYLATLALLCITGNAQSSTPLTLKETIALPGVTGKFDHFAIDLAGGRLFAAATGSHRVEVIDLKTNKVEQSIEGLGKPHGLAWADATGSLYVADGVLAELRVYKGKPLTLAGSIKLSDDADDMVYDNAHHRLYVGHGGGAVQGNVAVVDTDHFTLITNVAVSAHPEAIDLDAAGRRIFANIADASTVAVISGDTNTITAKWKLIKAAANVPMAFDAGRQRLYVACRTPAALLVLDATSGAEIARASTGAGVDDLFYDAALGRVYVISGAGEVDAFDVNGTSIKAIGVTQTAPGAKTALFVPTEAALYVGVPSTDGHAAEIRVYSTAKEIK